MNDVTNQAKTDLLDPSEIGDKQLSSLLGRVMSNRVDTGELFFQRKRAESWSLEDGKVRDSSFSVNQGVGIRAIQGEKTGFAFTNEISSRSLQQAADAAKSIAKAGQAQTIGLGRGEKIGPVYQSIDPIVSLDEQEKVALLNRLDRLAPQCITRYDVRVQQSRYRMRRYSPFGPLQYFHSRIARRSARSRARRLWRSF